MLAEGADCTVTLDGRDLPGRVVRIYPGSLYVCVRLDGCAPAVIRREVVAGTDDLESMWSAKRGLLDLANRAGVAHLELLRLTTETTGKTALDDLDLAEIAQVQEAIYTTRKGFISPF